MLTLVEQLMRIQTRVSPQSDYHTILNILVKHSPQLQKATPHTITPLIDVRPSGITLIYESPESPNCFLPLADHGEILHALPYLLQSHERLYIEIHASLSILTLDELKQSLNEALDANRLDEVERLMAERKEHYTE